MKSLLYFQWSLILGCITALASGIFVFLRNRKSLVNKTWLGTAFTSAMWSLGYFVMISSTSKSMAWWSNWFLHAFAIFIPAFHLHFVIALTEGRKKRVLISTYIISTILFLLNPSPLFIQNVIPKYVFNYCCDAGPLYISFAIYFSAAVLYSWYLLFSAIKKEKGLRSLQLKYFFLSSLFGFTGGGQVFFLTFNVPLPPVGLVLFGLYPLVVWYAIARYRLMDINVAITRAAIFAFVYTLVLGIPFGLAGWFRPWLISLFGQGWFWLPMFILLGLATVGPYIYLYLQRRTENALLKDQRRYQTALTELSERMTRIRDIDKLLEDIVSTITTARVSFIAIYLKDEEYKSFKRKAYYPKDLKSSLQELMPIDDPIISLLSAEKRLLLSEEMGSLKNLGPNPALILPCFMKDDLLCFIVLGTKPNNQIYTQDDIVVFEMLSYSTALAIENSIFWEEIQERQRKERIKEMDIYAYSLAHEIDNPMQVIMGSYYRLKEKIEKPDLTEEDKKTMLKSLDFMNEAATRVTGMVEAIRSFGSRTSGELVPLEIKDIIESFIRLYTPQFKSNSIIFTKEIPSEPIFVCGNKNELVTILINFAKNSIHAMESSKEKKANIKVVCTNSDLVRIYFSDTGHGIPKEKIHTIFAPFVTTKASSVGTGMGLYNVVNLVQRNKAKVWAESEGEGKGATLVLELLIAKDIKESDLLKKEDIKSRWKF